MSTLSITSAVEQPVHFSVEYPIITTHQKDWSSTKPTTLQPLPNQKAIKARLVYHYFKSTLYDLTNYQPISNPVRFKKALDRYFGIFETVNPPNYIAQVTTIFETFNQKDSVLRTSEDGVLTKIFPFNQIKPSAATHIGDTYRAMFNWKTER
ncbi:MAG: hypothetical protein AAF960_30015 [Bacteroidota bacterium]